MEEFQHYIRALDNPDYTLVHKDTYAAFQLIMKGKATPSQMGAFLMGLKHKGETVEQITGAVNAIRGYAERIMIPFDKCIDTCGTGGDNLGTLNISTAVAFVVAACGVPVAKHGNKAVSSRSGSADVLTRLGVKVDADTALVEKSMSVTNLCFMMAPKFHAAMRYVAPVRNELGIRTIFNLLGPLCNPATPSYQLMGVYDKKWVGPIAEVLQSLGSESAWVVNGDVHGCNGLDELTTTGVTHVAELKDSKIREFTVTPEDAGLPVATIADLQGHDAAYNAERLEELLNGQKDAYRDIVLLNAAAALVVAGKAEHLKQGVSIAAQAIDNRSALIVLYDLVKITNS